MNKSILLRILLSFISAIFLISITSIFIVRNQVSSMITSYTNENILTKQKEMAKGLSSIIDPISNHYSDFLRNPEFDKIMSDVYDEAVSQTVFEAEMKKSNINRLISHSVFLYHCGHYYSYHNLGTIDYHDSEFVKEITSDNKLLYHGGIVSDSLGKKCLVLGKKAGENDCLIYLIDISKIVETVSGIDSELGYTILLSNNEVISDPALKNIGLIVYESDLFESGTNTIKTVNDKKSVVIVSDCEAINRQYSFNYRLASIISYDLMYESVSYLNTYSTVAASIAAILGIILSVFLAGYLVKPIRNLISRLDTFISSGGTNKSNSINTHSELYELELSFDEMMNQIKNLIDDKSIEQENKRKLELYALQMQINPHFLYNTLDAIAWLAKIKHQTEIERLVLALAKFFRISLHKGDKFITVEEEFELIKNYIEIEQIRFPGKFDISYELEDDVKKLETMKLIIQPILENAIKHGISNSTNHGEIIVKAYSIDDSIYYEIIDNGVGFEVPKDLFEHKKEILSGYGLKNVDERIRLEYGNEYGLTIESHLNKGTKVIVRFKKRLI